MESSRMYSITLRLFLVLATGFMQVAFSQSIFENQQLQGGSALTVEFIDSPTGPFPIIGTGSTKKKSLIIPENPPLLPDFANPPFPFSEAVSIAADFGFNALVGDANGSLFMFDQTIQQWIKIVSNPGAGRTRVLVTGDSAAKRIVTSSDFGGILLSDDGGQTFSQPGIPPVLSFLNDMEEAGDTLIVGGVNGVALSTDKGETWNNTNFPDIPVNKVAADGQGNLYAGTFNAGLFKSEDGGSVWNQVIGGPPSNSYITALGSDGDSSIAVATLSLNLEISQVYVSKDAGENWVQVADSVYQEPVTDVAVKGDTTLLATIGHGLLRSVNLQAVEKANDSLIANTPAVLLTPDNNTLLAGNASSGIWMNKPFSNPQKWTRLKNSNLFEIYSGVTDNDGNSFFVGLGLFGQDIRFLPTGDSTLERRVNGISTPFIQSSAYSSTSDVVLVGGEGMFRSEDKGQSWTPSGNGLQGFVTKIIYAAVQNNFFAQTNFGLYRSGDEGLNWTSMPNPVFVRDMAADPVSGDVTFVVDSVFSVSAAGDTTTLRGGIPGDSLPRVVHYSKSGNLYGAVKDLGLFRYDKSLGQWVVESSSGLEGENPVSLTSISPGVSPGAADQVYLGSRGNGVFGPAILTGISAENQSAISSGFRLKTNYPNPFNPATTIRFEMLRPGFARVTVYDILGRRVEELLSEALPAGVYQRQWDAGGLGSGIYFVSMQVGTARQTRRMLLLK